jgi:ubiquinone/menaquinone biosynthesis C-methylase UbiE
MSRFFHRGPRKESSESGGIVPGGSIRDASGGSRSPGGSAARSDGDWRSYDSIAEEYERIGAPQTALVAADLIELARPPAGGRLLDVGTGTGVVVEASRESLGGNGLAVGIDHSLGMLAVGARARPQARFVAATAIDLPFGDATFDAATACFVIAHFPRSDTALFDMVRVLKPGGRLAVAAWAKAEEDEFQRTWRDLVEQVTTHELLQDAIARVAPSRERFADPGSLEGALRDIGLRPVSVQRREYRFQVARDDHVIDLATSASGRFVRDMLGEEGFRAFGERALATFADRFPERITDFRDVLLAVGTKPDSWVAGRAQGAR